MAGLHDAATTCDVVVSALRRFPDRVAFRMDGRDISYREAEDTLQRWVAVLLQRGFQPDQGVGLLSLNRPEAWFAQAAPALAGGHYTALHPLGSLDDHLHACNEAELRFLFVDPPFAERATQLLERAETVEAVFSLGPSDAGEDINQLAAAATVGGRLDRGPHGPEDMAYLLYTGGTTGVPKAAMLSERAFSTLANGTALGWDLPEEMRYLAVAPISHAAGMLILPTLMRGGTVILQRRFDPSAWLRGMAAERATISLLVPTMIYALLDSPELDRTDLSDLHTLMYGASPISPTRLAEGVERLGPVFCQLYGQTESGGQGTSLWRHQHDVSDLRRLTSCGTPMPFNRVAILDAENNPAPDGEAGEICIQGPSVMHGYWKQPELTEAALAGGWLHTGDIGVRDEEGFFYIVDRKKDMIVSGGFNVFPREIEDVLGQHPAVSACAVIGVPDEKWGEAVRALVVLRPGAKAEPEELIALVRERKGPVYAPKAVEFIESLPLTPVGKADKKVLRARYWEGRDRQVG
ncbi:MAG: acyl-CoA synthetase [Chloroflexi bacterium]|nr:MAG: acyl-CoA synthetase [Chloroflexota bacterium]